MNSSSKEEQIQPYTVYQTELTTQQFHVYINGPIRAPIYYSDLCRRLRTCAPDDSFIFYLNSPGGHLNTGVQIIHAMRDCPGTVVTVLDGTAASMAAIMFLAGDEFVVHDTGRLMLHNYSGGVVGKGNEQEAHLQSNITWFGQVMKDICYPFVSDQELDQIRSGIDMWFDSAQVRERLYVLKDFIEEQHKERIKRSMEEEENAVLQRIQERERKTTTKRGRAKSKPKATTKSSTEK